VSHYDNCSVANVWRATTSVIFRKRLSNYNLIQAFRLEPERHRWARHLDLAQIVSNNLLHCPFIGQFRGGSIDLAAEAAFHRLVDTTRMDIIIQSMTDSVRRQI
jgi:hypothetical protein